MFMPAVITGVVSTLSCAQNENIKFAINKSTVESQHRSENKSLKRMHIGTE